jgi:hypothetical protein
VRQLLLDSARMMDRMGVAARLWARPTVEAGKARRRAEGRHEGSHHWWGGSCRRRQGRSRAAEAWMAAVGIERGEGRWICRRGKGRASGGRVAGAAAGG